MVLCCYLVLLLLKTEQALSLSLSLSIIYFLYTFYTHNMLETSTSSLRTRRASKPPTIQKHSSLEEKIHSKPPHTHRSSTPKKHVVLIMAATAWCILSVSLLLTRVGVSENIIAGYTSNALFQAPPEMHTQSRNVYYTPPNIHNPSIPLDWNSTLALSMMWKQQSFHPPLFQFTMRDLARRVLSRHVANSNVLIIAPDVTQALHYNNSIPQGVVLDSVDSSSQLLLPLSVGGTFLLHAQDQGHAIHAMNAGLNINTGNYSPWNTTLDTWWSSYDTFQNKQQQQRRRPNWILLAVMDPGLGWEDLVWRNSQRFLSESTMTYIVLAVRSRLVGNTLHVYGIQAAKTLLHKRYKLQVLQTSHYHVEFDKNGREPPPRVFDLYGPNSLQQSQEDLEALLRWGAQAAKRYSNSTSMSPVFTAYLFGTQGLDLAIPSRRHYIHDSSRNVREIAWTQINLYKPVKFKPCPTPKSQAKLSIEFDRTNEKSDMTVWLYAGKNKPTSPEFKFPLSPWSRRMRGWSPLFRKLQNTWRDIRLYLHYYNDPITRNPIKGLKISSGLNGDFATRPTVDERGIETHYYGKDADGTRHRLQLWYDGENPRNSEAACARYKDVVTCETRVIYTPNPLWRSSTSNQLRKGGSSSHNNLDLLVIMLDPMSRGQLYRSMPQTKAILEELNFLQFMQYSAVGDNSGPNQAALYSGKPLADRDGIANDGKSEWLWDTLRNAGYATLKGEDGCIENSNMLQSLKPDTTHGEALNQMFCFDFNRPNCIGTQPAASYLLQYGRKFIDTYSSTSSNGPWQPWAAFLHFVDSHEDTSTLSTLLDSLLADFLRDAFESGKLDNAMVMMISDHGLHYGPYFQTLSGRRERTEPLLYIRTPPKIRNGPQGSIMERNAPLWTTPFDVHQTMIEATVGRRKGDEAASLFAPLPDSRSSCRGTSVIPERFCDLHDIFDGKAATSTSTETCPRTPRPPSILSFYADIPKNNRPLLLRPNCTNTHGAPFDFESECTCGTSHRKLFPCKEHPWGPKGANSTEFPEEYFAILKCPNRVERLDNRVLKRQEIVDRYHNRTSDVIKQESKNPGSKPSRSLDILFLEIDSISKAYGERHLPLTMQFMRKHQLRRDKAGEFQCANGICAVDFEKFGVVGANSVANQVPALSGCVVSRFHNSCFDKKLSTDKCLENGFFGTKDGCKPCPVGTFPIDPLRPCNTTTDKPEKCCTSSYPKYNASRICRDESLFENGLQLFRRGPRRHTSWCPTNKPIDKPFNSTPWLFDVARAKGYITYFGEEFCYDGSPYVTQENTFPLSTDFELRNIYCRLQSCKECEGPWPPMGPHICAEHDGENPAFSQLESMWNAYPDVPKFAFLNAIAAHDYDFQWIKMLSSIEAYDAQVASFLERITRSKIFENTVIIARADHGLQGGPTTVEYSLQVEHREPWTQILIPKNVAGHSLSTLYTNQHRLATGFDLYHTIRNLMSSSKEVSPLPTWTYDLFKTEIPANRTCQDAKIPPDFCPCEGAGLDRAPHFGVCNVFEPYCDMFCASNLDPPEPPEVIEK